MKSIIRYSKINLAALKFVRAFQRVWENKLGFQYLLIKHYETWTISGMMILRFFEQSLEENVFSILNFRILFLINVAPDKYIAWRLPIYNNMKEKINTVLIDSNIECYRVIDDKILSDVLCMYSIVCLPI